MSFLGKTRVIMLKGEKGDQGEAGTTGDYSNLTNKPTLNNVELDGDLTSDDLGLASVSRVEALEDTVEHLVVGEWTDLEITDPQSLIYSGGMLKYRLDASGLVTIVGNFDFSGSSASVEVATLPSDIRPLGVSAGGVLNYRNFTVPLLGSGSGNVEINIIGSTGKLSVVGSVTTNSFVAFEVSYYPSVG